MLKELPHLSARSALAMLIEWDPVPNQCMLIARSGTPMIHHTKASAEANTTLLKLTCLIRQQPGRLHGDCEYEAWRVHKLDQRSASTEAFDPQPASTISINVILSCSTTLTIVMFAPGRVRRIHIGSYSDGLGLY